MVPILRAAAHRRTYRARRHQPAAPSRAIIRPTVGLLMVRTVNTAAHTLRREAFVDAAWRLIQAKGYEQMSVQDVLDALDASRGAFYHYFDSKAALLQAVVERMVEESTAQLHPVLADPRLSALEKLTSLFSGVAHYKHDQKELVHGFMRVWFSDDNVLA